MLKWLAIFGVGLLLSTAEILLSRYLGYTTSMVSWFFGFFFAFVVNLIQASKL